MKKLLLSALLLMAFLATSGSFALEELELEQSRPIQTVYRYSLDNPMSDELRTEVLNMSEKERAAWVELNIAPCYVGKYNVTSRASGEWLETDKHVNAVYRDPNNEFELFQIETKAKFLVDTASNRAIDANTVLFNTRKFTPMIIRTRATKLIRWADSNIAKTYIAEAVNEFGYYSIHQQYNFNGNGAYSVRVY